MASRTLLPALFLALAGMIVPACSGSRTGSVAAKPAAASPAPASMAPAPSPVADAELSELLDDVTNGLSNSASDGDFRGRAENKFASDWDGLQSQRSRPRARRASRERLARGGLEGEDAGGDGGDEARSGRGDETDPQSGKKDPKRTWKRAQALPNASRLTVGDNEELRLLGLTTQVRVDGFRARVVLDCIYLNDRDTALEGLFQLRLPNEASPFFFAFGETVLGAAGGAAPPPDVELTADLPAARIDRESILSRRRELWKAPKEARMVPREKAAHAYVETTRRRIDPALMEWTGAGVFASRVFPLAPGKLHRIVIGYDVNLTEIDGELEFRLDLPEGVDAVTTDIEFPDDPGRRYSVRGADTKHTVSGGTERHRIEGVPDEAIRVRVRGAGSAHIAGDDPETGRYFAARATPLLPARETIATRTRGVFMLDTSLSSSPDRMNVWLALLERMLVADETRLSHFALLSFDVETRWWQKRFVENSPANREAALAYVRNVSLEGATDLGGALAEAAAPSWLSQKRLDRAAGAHDLFLLSDGSASWGETDLHAMTRTLTRGQSGSLFAYNTGFTGTDLRALEHLARETGGAVFSVTGESEIEAAALAHRRRPWRLLAARVGGTSDVILAGRPLTVFPGQALIVAGRGRTGGADAVLELDLEQEGTEVTVTVPLGEATESQLAPRVYGQIAVGQLEGLGDAAEPVAKSYATHFRVVGSTCSLLMLDSEEDYKRFDIKPEEDAYLVMQKPAVNEVARVLRDTDGRLGDPRAALTAWLDRMERTPGLSLTVSEALRTAIASMPDTAFRVTAPALVCASTTWDDVPGAVQEQLASRRLTYDVIRAEAERRKSRHGPADALRVLSSLIEERPGDGAMLRDVAYSAMEWDRAAQAYHLLRRAAHFRPYEPENYRAIAQCLEALGNHDLALVYYETCLAGTWDARFGEFRRIAAIDYLRLLRKLGSGGGTSVPEFAKARLATVAKEYDPGKVDLMVTITWNTDRTDVDLHVTDPTGEVCYYSNSRTKMGGSITSDVTQGFGPEMFVLPKATNGRYIAQAKYFSSDSTRASLRTKVFATVIRGWGTPNERVTRKVLTLVDGKQMHDIADLRVNE